MNNKNHTSYDHLNI